MDINALAHATTVISALSCFVGIVVWAFSRRNQDSISTKLPSCRSSRLGMSAYERNRP
jgi:hypothetical protein